MAGHPFPNQDLLQVKEVSDRYWGGDLKTMVFSRENIPVHIGCSNSICHEGGISRFVVVKALCNIAFEGSQIEPVVIKCQGLLGSEKEREIHNKTCFHAFEITVKNTLQ
ncbi:hypothetical protein [Tychonema sp. LEGE 07203]|uniref:hypothetical protein n=1 Tax=Tychonema sp. LEGE 07203 TaxID=1828671 RepID=UPI0018828671|nr:hypothetical protein [Tychonema sp. LEGE 07203]MBE9092431.1 hypothetical protein [Tychonema sp. LEGE 07203]